MDFKGQKSTPYIVDILHQHGVDHVIICPGSRNAPLTLAFTRHGKFNCLSIIDERSAGYFALGLTKSLQKPVAIICTSGTAVLNLAPAVAEAFHQQVPLIVLTADRPDSWIHQQDGQAIDQKNIYTNFVARSYSLKGELYHTDDLWMTERITNEAIHIAHTRSQPVHLNISFSEPLYDDPYTRVEARKVSFHHGRTFYSHWKNVLKENKNILVVLGQMDFDQRIVDAVAKMINCSNIVVAAENLANVPDSIIISNASEAVQFATNAMKPDVIVYAGGPVVSKQFKKYLSSLHVPVIRIQTKETEVDTFHANVSVIQQSIVDGMETLADYVKNESTGFASEWRTASDKAKKYRNEYLASVQFSDMKVFGFLAKKLSSSAVHLSNSTPVRYAQLFNDLYHHDIHFYSNRGTSGIDGATSTAVGFSYLSDRINFLITGELAFQYDSNAFFNDHLKGNLKIIVINNSGGNIFRVIDGPRDQPEREKFFETALKYECSNLAKHFDLNYYSAKDEQGLNIAWLDFVKNSDNNRPSILEVFTEAETSARTFKEFYKKIQS